MKPNTEKFKEGSDGFSQSTQTIAASLFLPNNQIALALFLSFLLGSCIEVPVEFDEETIDIGVLLPFTGDIAASGANIERALIMVIEQVNEAGGIAGKPLRLVTDDTHSDVRRGLSAARRMLENNNLVALIGPENEDLAMAIVPLIRERRVVQISGGLSSPNFSVVNDNGYFFRTTPSSRVYAQALAKQMEEDEISRAAVVYVADEYGTGFSAVMTSELARIERIQTFSPISFFPSAQNYSNLIARIYTNNPDGIVLIGHPRSSATIVTEWSITAGAKDIKWYLAPTLKAEIFIDNLPPGILHGSTGVSPKVLDEDQNFASTFSQRWKGEALLGVAYFYYDAAALLVLAIASAAHEAGGVPTGEQVRDWLIPVSGPDGVEVFWDQLDRGVDLAKRGESLNYQGVSGSVDLDDRGDVLESQIYHWTIIDDRFESLEGGQ